MWVTDLIIYKHSKSIILDRAGEPVLEPEPVGAGCFWLLEAGAGAA